MVPRIDDMATEQRWRDYTAQVLQHGVPSSLSVPVPCQGTVIGALYAYSSKPAAFATPEAVDATLIVAETVAVAMVNAQAHGRLAEKRPICASPWSRGRSSSRPRA
ncbi:hypothetical protein Gobs01_01514 [Geodermatophilus obscurus DSM 43160]